MVNVLVCPRRKKASGCALYSLFTEPVLGVWDFYCLKRYSSSTSLAPKRASASTAQSRGWNILRGIPSKRNPRKGSMVDGPCSMSRSAACFPAFKESNERSAGKAHQMSSLWASQQGCTALQLCMNTGDGTQFLTKFSQALFHVVFP